MAWTLLATAEFWGLGPWSFIAISNELDYGPPLYEFLNTYHDGGTYTHAYAGGNDIFGMAGTGGQYLSLERVLVALMPFWLANGVHKILFVGLGFVGIYKISRHCGVRDRFLAGSLAAFCTLSHELVIDTTWFAGFGYALIPLAIYLSVLRTQRRHYYWGVIAIAALNAISCEPVHSVMVLLFTMGVTTIALRFGSLKRVIVAFTLFVILLLANWHEAFYAMAQLAPLSARYDLGTPGLGSFSREWVTFQHFGGSWSVLALIALAVIGMGRIPLQQIGWLSIALLIATFSSIFLISLPWEKIGLAHIGAINFRYLYSALPIAAVLVLSQAVASRGPRQAFLAVAVFALAFGQFGWAKAYHAAVWLSEGGVALYETRFERLALDWRPNEPHRTVAIPYRLPLNTSQSMGLDSFDGFINLQTLAYRKFWDIGVTNPTGAEGRLIGDTGNSGLYKSVFSYKCCQTYAVEDIADLDLLRIANVRYILSVLPLSGDGIHQVSGPVGDTEIPRAPDPLLPRLLGYARLNFSPSKIRVFEISNALPRVFAPRCLERVSDDVPTITLLKSIKRSATNRCVVINTAGYDVMQHAKLDLKVKKFALVKDGFDVQVDAPNGGIVAFNVGHVPYWKATADGKPVTTTSGNLVHTTVAVPAGTKSVSLRYIRPLLRQQVFGLN